MSSRRRARRSTSSATRANVSGADRGRWKERFYGPLAWGRVTDDGPPHRQPRPRAHPLSSGSRSRGRRPRGAHPLQRDAPGPRSMLAPRSGAQRLRRGTAPRRSRPHESSSSQRLARRPITDAYECGWVGSHVAGAATGESRAHSPPDTDGQPNHDLSLHFPASPCAPRSRSPGCATTSCVCSMGRTWTFAAGRIRVPRVKSDASERVVPMVPARREIPLEHRAEHPYGVGDPVLRRATTPAARRRWPSTSRSWTSATLGSRLERLLGARLDEVGQVLCGRQPEAEWSPIGHPDLQRTQQRSSTIKLEKPS
jgi:hypothetical protein